MEDKIVYISQELESLVSANKRLKYAILLGTSDSLDSTSAVYDSLKRADTKIPAEGSVYFAFLKILDFFLPDSNSKMFFIKPIAGYASKKFFPGEGHLGIDYAVKTGTSIYAVSGGLIIFSDFTSDYGNMLIIQHNEGYLSMYKHCSSLIKKEREYVHQGELIALSGNSGTETTGPHLHFEIWKDGKPIDPEKIFIK